MVTLTDPEGFPVNLIYGQKAAEKGKYPDKLAVNYEDEKPRIRRFLRFQPGPAAVHKVRTHHKAIRNHVKLTAIRSLGILDSVRKSLTSWSRSTPQIST